MSMSKLYSFYSKMVVFPLRRFQCDRTHSKPKSLYDTGMGEPYYINQQYHIVKLRGPGDSHNLKQAFIESFMKDEPFIKMLGLTGHEGNGELLNIFMNEFSYEESLVARSNRTNEILGFALNGSYDHDSFAEDVAVKKKSLQDSRNKKVLDFMLALSSKFKHECVRPVSTAMEIFYLGVVPKARGQGMAKQLIFQSLVLAKCKGYGVVQVFCTNHKSAQACASLKMIKACDIHYQDLMIESDGRPIAFKAPPHPDNVIKVYYYIT